MVSISLAQLGVDDGEYFSGSAGSGTVVKGTKTFVADNSSSGVVLDSLSGLTPTADNVDKIIRIGDDEYSKYSDEMSTYEKMIWFDGTNPSMFPENSEASFPIYDVDNICVSAFRSRYHLTSLLSIVPAGSRFFSASSAIYSPNTAVTVGSEPRTGRFLSVPGIFSASESVSGSL